MPYHIHCNLNLKIFTEFSDLAKVGHNTPQKLVILRAHSKTDQRESHKHNQQQKLQKELPYINIEAHKH